MTLTKPAAKIIAFLFKRPEFLLLGLLLIQSPARAQVNKMSLIAHRGGVVDSTFTENGLPALKKAASLGYAAIETDMRVTRDGILIANHDADFERYYGLKQKVTGMAWPEIQKLSSKLDQNKPVELESVLRFCQENKMYVMLDNKISGLDTLLFNKLLGLLDQYDLRKNALMIGTDESTEFFTGKIKLSCTRKQLEENTSRKDYHPDHYFLFDRPANLSQDDVRWAKQQGITVVAAINKYHYRNTPDMYQNAKRDCETMKSYGINHFQIDSEFAAYCK
jgi:glycerophosphoryl diester phosphodiesterase